jgi:hypothetical protein
MSLEILNTTAALGTFLVITATAIAALIQLRHARSSNQIAALNELRASQQTDHFIKALHCVYSELPLRIHDPEFRYQLTHRNERTPEFNEVLSKVEAVGDSYENFGVLAKAELVDRRLLLDFYTAVVLDAWAALIDTTAILRAHYGSSIWENFEYLAVLAQDWNAARPNGSYPRGLRRIEVPNRWREADEQYALGRRAVEAGPAVESNAR